MNTTSSFVYLMFAGDYVKIGVTSSSIRKRLKGVQTGCPLPIYSVSYFTFETRAQSLSAEKQLHLRFKKYRTAGEWFFRPKHVVAFSASVLKKDHSQLKINDEKILPENIAKKQHNRTIKTAIKNKQSEIRKDLKEMDISEMSNKEHIAYMKEKNKLSKHAKSRDNNALNRITALKRMQKRVDDISKPKEKAQS